MLATGTTFRKGEVAPAGEFESRREHGGIEIEYASALNLDAKLDATERKRLSFQDPASRAANGRRQGSEQDGGLLIRKALEVDGARRGAWIDERV